MDYRHCSRNRPEKNAMRRVARHQKSRLQSLRLQPDRSNFNWHSLVNSHSKLCSCCYFPVLRNRFGLLLICRIARSLPDRPTLCAFLIGAWSSFTIYPFILLSSLVFLSNGSPAKFHGYVFISAITAILFTGVSFAFNGNNSNFIGSTYSVM